MSFLIIMWRTNTARGESKFTRGEKCICIHLIVTFVLILALLIIYFVHLCLVQHNLRSALKITRRKTENYEDNDTLGFVPVGLLYLNEVPARVLCNSMLLTHKWSLAPGHCVAVRSDPDMARLLRAWRIKYRTQIKSVVSEIKRSMPHPHFSRDDFSNNVGVIEHLNPIDTYKFVFPDAAINDATLQVYENNMVMVAWGSASPRQKGENEKLIKHFVKPVKLDKCARFVAPIVDLRSYEFCVIPQQRNDNLPDHGAVFTMGSQIYGLFSWGEKSGKGVPFVIINIIHFKEWIENIIN